jgi:hypothetical protein
MDAIAVQYARELSRWGIETSIIVPGAFTSGTNHFAHSGKPTDGSTVGRDQFDARSREVVAPNESKAQKLTATVTKE